MTYSTAATRKELQFTTAIARPSRGMSARRVQEWLGYHGLGTAIDADFGVATESSVKAFQLLIGKPQSGKVDAATWAALTASLSNALDYSPTSASLDAATLQVAQAHLAQHPREFGGDNRGPWVRAYMDGNEGVEWKWCAGFVTFVLKQAAYAVGVAMPFPGSFSCDVLAAQAQQAGRFVKGSALAGNSQVRDSLGAVFLFLVRRTSTDWTHVGLGFNFSGDTFETIEGNTNDEGSSNGYEVCQRRRGIASKDFIRLT